MSRVAQKACLIALAVAYVATGGLGASCYLCIGSDGHIRVETARSLCGSCCDGVGRSSPHDDACGETACASSEPCGSCIDIPLLSESQDPTVASSKAKAQGPDPAFALFEAPLVGVAVVLTALASREPPQVPAARSLSHLETVRLRL